MNQVQSSIAIIDCQIGNIGSIANMLKKVGASSQVIKTPDQLSTVNKIILPGVGSFDNAIIQLKNLGFIEALTQKVLVEKSPFLGICLGMQLLSNASEEGKEQGLGWIPGVVKRFDNIADNYKKLIIPHMGWNNVTVVKKTALTSSLPDNPRFYFVHSYYFECEERADIMLTTEYGNEFTSGVHKGNIMGVQFHPEKSHKFGMKFMKNFVEL